MFDTVVLYVLAFIILALLYSLWYVRVLVKLEQKGIVTSLMGSVYTIYKNLTKNKIFIYRLGVMISLIPSPLAIAVILLICVKFSYNR